MSEATVIQPQTGKEKMMTRGSGLGAPSLPAESPPEHPDADVCVHSPSKFVVK